MPENTGINQERDELGRFPKGVSGNPAGKPKGAVTFATKWAAVVEKLAKQNKITVDEVDEQLFLMAYKKAKEGEYAFYRDIQDRLYGRPTQPTDLTTGGEPLFSHSEELLRMANELSNKIKETYAEGSLPEETTH